MFTNLLTGYLKGLAIGAALLALWLILINT